MFVCFLFCVCLFVSLFVCFSVLCLFGVLVSLFVCLILSLVSQAPSYSIYRFSAGERLRSLPACVHTCGGQPTRRWPRSPRALGQHVHGSRHARQLVARRALLDTELPGAPVLRPFFLTWTPGSVPLPIRTTVQSLIINTEFSKNFDF